MGITPAGHNEAPRTSKTKYFGFGFPVHTIKRYALAAKYTPINQKAPACTFWVKPDETVLLVNRHSNVPKSNWIAEGNHTFMLSSREGFDLFKKRYAWNTTFGFIFDPASRYFAIGWANTEMTHDKMTATLHLANDRYRAMKPEQMSAYVATSEDLLQKGAFRIDGQGNLVGLSTIIWASWSKGGTLQDGAELQRSYYDLGTALKDLGFPDDMPITDYTPAQELRKFYQYLQKKGICTLGDMLRTFKPL